MTPARIKDLMNSNSEGIFVTLIDISHPDLAEPLHFANNNVDITFEDTVYTGAAFTFDPPDSKAGDGGSSKVSICVVDQQMINVVLSLDGPPHLMAHHIINMQNGAIEELEEWEFTLYNITSDSLIMSGDLIYETFLDTAIPAPRFDITNFPGCF